MSADVVVDATPEENIEGPMKSLTVSNEKQNLPFQSDVDFDEDEFTPHNDWFPPKLRKKLNVAIIHDDKDEGDARDMKVFIEKNVCLKFGHICFRPRVELLEYMSSDIRVDPLDHALGVADYIFVYITHYFNDRRWNQFQAIASVKAILTGHNDTQCSLVCVHTDQSWSSNLPAKLTGVKHLHYHTEKQEQFKDDVSKYFFEISGRLLKKRDELRRLRKEYVKENPHILQTRNPETSKDNSKHLHQKETVRETSKSSHDQSLSASKDKTKRPGKHTPPANVEERVSGASGNGAKQPINPQPHYR